MRWATTWLVFAVVLGVLLQLRYGYQSGTNDHLVLSLQGLQWGRVGFLANDWFIASAPQPHVLFDLVTWLGASTGHLTGVYLIWWLLGLLVGGLATAVLAFAWTPTAPIAVAAAVAVLLGLGPEVALGSTTPALPTALPHQLGGFLAYLTGALLLTRRHRAAAAASVATSVVHVQIGALIAVVTLLAFLGLAVIERRGRWSLLVGSLLSAGIVATVLRMRPVASDGKDFVEICHEIIPYHCDAATWSAGQLGSGFAVVAAALLSIAFVPRGAAPGRSGKPSADRSALVVWAAVVLAPAVGLTAGVLGNRYGVPVIGRFAQSTNIFRLAVLLLPFAAWGLIAGFVRLTGWRRLAWVTVAAVAGFGWLVPADGATALPKAPGWGLAVLIVAAVAVLAAGQRTSLRALGGVVAIAVLVTGAVQTRQLRWRPLNVAFVADPALRAMGTVIAEHVPPGGVIIAPPSFGVIRLTSGRSVLVDCKAVPYGGPAWREYQARLDALGGEGACHGGGRPFARVTPGSLLDTARRYGADYVVLTARDPRVRALVALGWRVLSIPYVKTGNIWLLAAPEAVDAAELSAVGR